ncbi:MAG: DUF1284 domain-containing protein [Nanoarchaeota archaeon]|nr:DUF1284 domain-containing protein [Nanoarchaeota archaeon]
MARTKRVILEKRLNPVRINPSNIANLRDFLSDKNGFVRRAVDDYGFEFLGKMSMIAFHMEQDARAIEVVSGMDDLCAHCKVMEDCRAPYDRNVSADMKSAGIEKGKIYTGAEFFEKLRGQYGRA